MNRDAVISPRAINILCEAPRRHTQQRNTCEPPSTPDPKPEKKSFWGRIWDKTKKVCEEVTKAVIAVGAFVAGVAVMLEGAAKAKKNFNKLREEPHEKSNKKSHKSHKKSKKKSHKHKT